MHPDPLVFAFVLVAALVIFISSCVRKVSFVALGRRGDHRTDHVGHRIANMARYGFAQKRIVQKKFGFNHLVMFWAFVILLFANVEFVVKGLNPAASFMSWPAPVHDVIYCIFDITSLVALITVIIAIIRRTFAPPYPEGRTADAYVVLCLIAILMVAYFSLHGIELEQGTIQTVMPISAWVGANIYGGLSQEAAATAVLIWWWVHAVTLLFFLNYLPYSKHIHILTALPNMFFSRDDYDDMLQPEDFSYDAVTAGEHLGAGRIDELSWKDLFDSYSCTECGRCQMECPAHITGKDLNPRLMMHTLKLNLNANGAALKRGEDCRVPLLASLSSADKPVEATVATGSSESATSLALSGIIDPKILWQCTTCGKCMEVCPVLIEHVPKIIEMRRNLVEMKAEFPEELLAFFDNIEQRANPWGIAPSERGKWCETLPGGFEAHRYNENCEYLLFVGCAGSFDSRAIAVTHALVKVLDAAGISWGILGKEEPCCGESLRQLGNEYLFNAMATANVAQFKKLGVKKIITMCPHCYYKLDTDYRDEFGLDAEVIHHTKLIADLLATGKLKLREGTALPAPAASTGAATGTSAGTSTGTAATTSHVSTTCADGKRIVYHDSCILGRYCHEYEAPRDIIASVSGAPALEMERNREKSFCCGAGGGLMWLEETEGTRVNVERVNEALRQKPDIICVNCPYCMTMFEDGLKESDHATAADGGDVVVEDIAELVADHLA